MTVRMARILAQIERPEEARRLMRLEANKETLKALRELARELQPKQHNAGIAVVEVMGLPVLENDLLADGVIAKVFHVDISEREVFRDGWSNA